MDRIESCLFDFCCWWTSWQESACQVWEDYTSPLTLFKLELLHPPSLSSLKGLNLLQMCGCVFVRFHCFYILSNPIYPTFHQRHSKLLTITFNSKKRVHHFNVESMFSYTCHFKLPWQWRRCCRAWWTTTWWTANELVLLTIIGPFPVKSCTLENANWRSCNNRWLNNQLVRQQLTRLQN